jgi:hypothetical protein
VMLEPRSNRTRLVDRGRGPLRPSGRIRSAR